MPVRADLSGKIFGHLLAISYSATKSGNAIWVCLCRCGALPEVAACHLKARHTESCGCYQVERARAAKTTHGHGHPTGARRISPEYSSWQNMKSRCEPGRSTAKYWGDLGISVCERWANSFEAFLEDVGRCPGPGYSIDRKNSSKNYEPGNCHWATRKEQCDNRASYGSWLSRKAGAETGAHTCKGRPTWI